MAGQVNIENLNSKDEYFLNCIEIHPSGMSLALGYAYEDVTKLTQNSFIVGVGISHKGGVSTISLKPTWSFNVIVSFLYSELGYFFGFSSKENFYFGSRHGKWVDRHL